MISRLHKPLVMENTVKIVAAEILVVGLLIGGGFYAVEHISKPSSAVIIQK
jgi:hypothetical protein